MLYWNTEVRSQSKVLPSRSQLALLMELLIKKRFANKFPVVCLLGGVLLHIPATLSGFLGCSAPLDPKECLLLSVTSEAWLSSLPHCKHFFLSRAPGLHSVLETPCSLGFSFPTQLAVGSSSISHLRVLSCSLHLSLFSGRKGCVLLPEHIISKVSRQTSSMQLLLFQIICDTMT